ncbi:maleate cis-trans isomerase [Kribbella amoyensis]|uniref:maleate cis-trans isomerase family protein n=1 Tax=Kribbella amoyensis TaxID=996641 RepID=UPI0011A66DA0|nr:maleate cis-trans isomerase [Kribbella amoyensis]
MSNGGAVWQPDGWDARTRIGVLTPHADLGPESELQAMAPSGVRIHAARVPFGAMASGGAMSRTIPLAPVEAFVRPPHIDEALALLAAAPLGAIGIGFTSAGYVVGAAGERKLIERLHERGSGVPIISTCASAVEGLRELKAERIALFDPPWFDAELNRLGAEYFGSQGFEVRYHAPCGLPSRQQSINPAELYRWIRDHTPAEADAIFVGGNGFRAVGVIAALEEDLGRPVLTANQALLWTTLRAAGSHAKPAGYGALFAL